MTANVEPLSEDEKKRASRGIGRRNGMTDDQARQLAIAYFTPYAPEYGGVAKTVRSKRGND